MARILAGGSELKVQTELKKCQLLCESCHERKTLEDFGQLSGKETHGTMSSYHYCKCLLCKEAWNAWHRVYKKEWKKRKKEKDSRP